MNKMLLFNEDDFDSITKKDAEIENFDYEIFDYNFKLGDNWNNLKGIYIIRVLKKCPICQKYSIIKEHPQILTNEEMIKKGWIEIEPFIWVVLNLCSRKCETKSKK